MENSLRSRKTDYPRTYFLYKTKIRYYLLFWLEHGKDNSLYIWFDDDSNNSWELVVKHNQDKFSGSASVELEHKSFAIFDPHISWHQ